MTSENKDLIHLSEKERKILDILVKEGHDLLINRMKEEKKLFERLVKEGHDPEKVIVFLFTEAEIKQMEENTKKYFEIASKQD